YTRKVDRLTRRFIFGGRPAWSRTAPWHESTGRGGLGIYKISDMNDALLTKVGHDLMEGHKPWKHMAEEELWPHGAAYLAHRDSEAPETDTENRLVRRRRPKTDYSVAWIAVRRSIQRVADLAEEPTLETADILALPAKAGKRLREADL